MHATASRLSKGTRVREARRSRYAPPAIVGTVDGRQYSGLIRVRDDNGDVHTIPAWRLTPIDA